MTGSTRSTLYKRQGRLPSLGPIADMERAVIRSLLPVALRLTSQARPMSASDVSNRSRIGACGTNPYHYRTFT